MNTTTLTSRPVFPAHRVHYSTIDAHLPERLHGGARISASPLELTEQLHAILDQLRHVLDYGTASIQQIVGNSSEIIAGRGFADADQRIGRRVPLDVLNPVSEIYATHRLLLLSDVQGCNIQFREGEENDIVAWLGVPLVIHEQLIGVLTIARFTPEVFTQDHVSAARAFAEHIAAVIENARLYHDAMVLAEQNTILHQASLAISTALDLENLCHEIYVATRQLMPVDAFVIALADAEQEQIDYRFLIQRGQRFAPTCRHRDFGLAGHVIRYGDSVRIGAFDAEVAQAYCAESFAGPLVPDYSVLAVPLVLRNQVIGMLSAQADGRRVYTDLQLRALEQLAANAAIAIDNARLFAEIQRLATVDTLTGIANRNQFFHLAEPAVEQAHQQSSPLALMLIDADRFKQINDTLGHVAGDAALRAIANRCNEALRSSDLLARYGGEELVVVLPETDLTTALVVAERLRGRIARPVPFGDAPPFDITCSLGVAQLQEGETLDALIDRADKALYRAKREGRNRVCWA